MFLFDNQYHILNYDEKNNILEQVWKEHSKNMSEETYMKEMDTYVDFIKQFQPQYILSNTTNLLRDIPESFQIWYKCNVLPSLEAAHVKKHACIVSQNLATQFDLVKMLRHSPNELQVKYFKDERQGKEWLISKN